MSSLSSFKPGFFILKALSTRLKSFIPFYRDNTKPIEESGKAEKLLPWDFYRLYHFSENGHFCHKCLLLSIKNGILKLKPPFHANYPPKWWGRHMCRAFITFGWGLNQFWNLIILTCFYNVWFKFTFMFGPHFCIMYCTFSHFWSGSSLALVHFYLWFTFVQWVMFCSCSYLCLLCLGWGC